MHGFRHFFLKIRIRSLRVDILTAFMAILLITFVLFMSYTFRKHSKVILEFSSRLMYEVGEVAVLNVTDFLGDAEEAVEMGASFTQSLQDITIDNQELVTSLFTAMSFNPFLQFYGIGTVEGTMLGVAHTAKGSSFQTRNEPLPDHYVHATRMITNKPGEEKEHWIYYDRSWQKLDEEILPASTYDPRERMWYKAAIEKGEPVWSDIYQFDTTKMYGITIAVPSYNPSGDVIGVFLADISLEQIATVTEKQMVSENAREMIINTDGEIIAAPRSVIASSLLRKGKHSTVYSIEDERFADALMFHKESGDKDFVFTSDKQKYLATLTHFPDKFRKDWIVIVIAPLEDFLGKVVDIQKKNVYLSIGIFIAAGFFVFFISRRISRPIVKLAGEIDQIKQFNLDRKNFSPIIH